ncbi:DUF1611 domain-containing protein [Maribacter polysiphoniae]|uniref:DUF1611 domain-containing protein n=1 Tax=Maribacter polysiphoniae TaxID=429344 RepID=A0A316DQT3_9FLAO|nr:DUF1611 domain-containing protein [Maribacter polysiphoniae]MBD1262860.1 DUF1611 domain-containing protein [Maribacter polysiphoniae]PWK20176.1 putative NAD-dependent epimerase/dehydratase family protein [Maribacter polysiphoniae]
MIGKEKKLAIYMEGNLDSIYAKMGYGVMRYSENPIVCVIDSDYSGKTVNEVIDQPFAIPIVASVEKAIEMGAEVMVLGLAPTGGKLPVTWVQDVEKALTMGMSLVNGLHDLLAERFAHLLHADKPEQVIWDVRKPVTDYAIARARASALTNKRVLMIGTDMAVGKMTAGLEVYKWIKEQGISTDFIATGQIGITVTGKGIPLDAIKVDQACGAVEHLVLGAKDKDIVFIEGQGSLLHPGSTATLPLMRGCCPTHLILCHRGEMTTLRDVTDITIPPLNEVIKLNEAVANACGSFPKAKTVGIAVNTSKLSESEALQLIEEIEKETGLPVTDVVRFGAEKIGRTLI